MKTVHGFVSGHVQGVGYRYFVRSNAKRQKVTGWAKNLPDGRVEVLLQGGEVAIDIVVAALCDGPPLSSVSDLQIEEVSDFRPVPDFSIR